jgi:hypothetical protein
MRPAGWVLLDLAPEPSDLGDLVSDDRLHVVAAHCADPPADVLLIRPDGYVAWAGTDGLPEAVTTWLTPRSA